MAWREVGERGRAGPQKLEAGGSDPVGGQGPHQGAARWLAAGSQGKLWEGRVRGSTTMLSAFQPRTFTP